jgi:DNA-binding IclR family transcriptional regulator
VIGAMSIAAPTSRVSAERIAQLAQLLVESANAASAALGYRAEAPGLAAD